MSVDLELHLLLKLAQQTQDSLLFWRVINKVTFGVCGNVCIHNAKLKLEAIERAFELSISSYMEGGKND